MFVGNRCAGAIKRKTAGWIPTRQKQTFKPEFHLVFWEDLGWFHWVLNS